MRLFNAYGPGQRLGYFIPDMIEKAKKSPIGLKDWNTTKDWVYVEDVARAFCTAVETPYVGPINIGTGIETSLLSIVRMIIPGTGSVANNLMGSPTEGTRMQANWSRAKRVLGWEPTVTIEEGLSATLREAKAQPIPA